MWYVQLAPHTLSVAQLMIPQLFAPAAKTF